MAKPQQQQKQQPKPWSVHRYLQRFSNEECMDNFFKSIEICNRMEQKVEKRVLEIEKRVLESSEDEDDNIDDGDGDDGGRIKKNGKSGKQQRKKWVANVMRQMNHMRNDKRNLVIRNGKSDKISLHTTVEQQKQTQQQNSTTSVKQANPQKEAVVNDDIEFDSSDDEANLINTSLSWQSQQGQRQRQGNSMIQINNSDNTKKRPLSNDHASTGTTCTIAMTTNHQKQIENNTNNNHMNGRTEKKARIENKQISASRESMAQQQNKTTAGNVVDKKNSNPSSNNDDQSQQRGQNSNNEKQTTTSTTESAGCVYLQLKNSNTNMDSFMPSMVSRLINHFWWNVNMKEDEVFCKLNFPPTANIRKGEQGGVKSKDRVMTWEKGGEYIENGQPAINDGFGSFGLVKDVGHAKEGVMKMPLFIEGKPEMIKFLLDLKKAISIEKRMTLKHLDCMRLNVVKGANTLKHTDTMRCTMIPNHFIFAPYKHGDLGKDSMFCLKLHKFPLFKTSVVKYNGRPCIPFHYEDGQKGVKFKFDINGRQGGFLQMMVYCEIKNGAKWLILPTEKINELEPFEKLTSFSFPITSMT